jgi:hypothetical protein
MGQGNVSKLERRADMDVSALASYLQAVGADLEIRAVFPDGRAVKITQFLKSQFSHPALFPDWNGFGARLRESGRARSL